ncbi:type II toxin-antitoxin system RelE/ParE family toxin [Halomonas sp. EGI 63088]|uniref:Type II toxin-antitoxin system RelE/ParE family toxin n=1 Tax=Halomonas flagellata TaxID=2920385 RepID=A0ABS9RUW4_9GAMM|nr:type II toxin-antitoxin system RelE/ParE family toxin [Halomonas flagellata]MCH4563658.1 type II toxin-antitoxin system RelE/ParE family toxin [Halomonas flagellata]
MWHIVTVERFDSWFLQLSEAEQESVLTGLFKLESLGPQLGRPDVDSLKGSRKVTNLKELRIQHGGKPFRILFAFDPARQAVMLCGGDKTGDKRFYQTMIPIAEREFIDHLASLGE